MSSRNTARRRKRDNEVNKSESTDLKVKAPDAVNVAASTTGSTDGVSQAAIAKQTNDNDASVKDSSPDSKTSKDGQSGMSQKVKDAEAKATKNVDNNEDRNVVFGGAGSGDKNAVTKTGSVDNDGGVKSMPVKQEAVVVVKAMMEQKKPIEGLPKMPSGNAYLCTVCMAQFASADALTIHQTTHSIGTNAALTSYSISTAVQEFIQSWAQSSSAANNKSKLTVAEVDSLMMTEGIRLITWDSGLCTSFELVPVVDSNTIQDVISYSWFSSSYDITTPFPQAAVVRIVLRTNWAASLDSSSSSRECDLRLAPPTENNVRTFAAILNNGITPEGTFNPNTLRMNVLAMCLRFVLSNLHLNRSTPFTMDLSSAAPNLSASQLRVIPNDTGKKWIPIMYPSRVQIPLYSKTADFVNQCIRDRIGRYDRAQTLAGAPSEWADMWETCDTLTLAVRELWMNRVAQMNISPADIADAISRCSQMQLTVSAPTAPSVARLLPWRVTTPERQLLQVLMYLNVGTNADYIQPILSAFSRTLTRVSPLRINPTLIANAMSTIVESTTNTQSPAAAILSKLKPVASDFSDFRLACAAWLYNGCVQTYLSEDSYPSSGGSVTSIDTLVDMFVCLLALPLVTDPNAPCQAFMIVANAMVGYENLPMDDPNFSQQRLAAAFNNPSTWPQCFIHPQNIDRRQCPVLSWWAQTIHRLWPTPSQITYGAPDIIGSANVFTPPDVLLLPIQNRPIRITNPTWNVDNEMTVWRNAVVELIKRIITNGRYQPNWNPSIRASMLNAMSNFSVIKTCTPAYMAELLPMELAAIAPTLPFQPFQVPFARLNRDAIVTHVNVSRQSADVIAQPALNMPMTQQRTGVPVALSARPLAVAMLSGEYPVDPPLQTNVWYVNALTPIYSNDGLFNNVQHAMVASEAYATMLAMISQCTDMLYPIDRPLNWLRQISLAANEATVFGKTINQLFQTAFDLSPDTVLLQPFLEADPRATQVAISYVRYDTTVETFVPQVRPSMITEALLIVERTLSHEYNLFGLCRGDVIIGQYMTPTGFNPLCPPSSLVFSRGDPDVFVFGERSFAHFGMNGEEITVTDAQGIKRPLLGDWVMPVQVLMMNIGVFPKLILDRILKGKLRIRLEVGAYPYVIQYYQGRNFTDGFSLLEQWLLKLSPMGMPPVPFLMPQSENHNVTTNLVTHYIWATEFNDGSLFVTNSDSPITVFGPDKSVPIERYRPLVDPGAQPATNQLPYTIDLYSSLRRYYLETPPITATITTYGDGLPALNR
uniref:Lambda A core shell protein n=1 Tax=Cataraqui virus TaxID=2776967 RepID=A0A8E4VPV9_9REOV|nr:MAG: lambda A core shell protein [Cataraqui virus]QPB10693.1 MAG: lambda A core shell protein [Cataraqui virus]